MLEASVVRQPFTIEADGGVITNQVLEDALDVTEMLDVKVVFVNTHATQEVDITLVRTVDLGSSTDPEDDGIFSVTEVDAETITAGGQYVYTPGVNQWVVFDDDAEQTVKHYFSAAHTDSGLDDDDVIIQVLIVGKVESVTRTNIPNFTRSTD